MAKKGGGTVYRVTEVIGTSTNSWEDAARNAVNTAAGTLRDLRIAEIEKLDVRIEDGTIAGGMALPQRLRAFQRICEAVAFAHDRNIDIVIGLGGGSSMDVALPSETITTRP